MAKQTMKLVYFVDTNDNHKDEVCVFNPKDYPNKEDLATAINKNISEMGFLDEYEDMEGVNEIGRSLAYTNTAKYKEYEFGIEEVDVI